MRDVAVAERDVAVAERDVAVAERGSIALESWNREERTVSWNRPPSLFLGLRAIYIIISHHFSSL